MPSKADTYRRALVALALAALVVTAGCAGAVGETPAETNAATDATTGGDAGTTENGESISVAATGSVTADPDQAVVHVAARSTTDSASAARRQVAENVSALRDALADAGVPEKRVTTEHYDIRQTRESRESTARTEYRAVHALAVEVDDVSRVGEIIRTAVENGASDVQHVEYTLSEDRRDELRDRALTRATSNAREDADVLSSNANLSIVGVESASTGGANVRPYRAELTAAAAANDGGGATRIDSGPVTVTANVEVTYEATD